MNIRNENVFDDIKTYDDYFFNTILTDPPYQLGSTWFVDDDGKYKIKGKSSDFMNKWDGLDHNDLDLFFKESFRTLKHGGYLLMFGMDRQLGPLHYYAVKNGFEINQSLYWYFVSNFPKATDASKMIDKRLKKDREVVGLNPNHRTTASDVYKLGFQDGKPESPLTEPASDLAKIFDGYKYSKAPLKQMVETICVFSKPTKNKSVLDDIMEWSEGVDLLNYCPKVGKKERNMGLDAEPDTKFTGRDEGQDDRNVPHKKRPGTEKNNHPTLKPINLIKEISSLFKLPEIVNQKVYVPFSGSGSEVCGLISAGYDTENIYGCELNKEYFDIGMKRIKHHDKSKID